MTTTTMSADEIQSLYTDGLALQNSGQAEAAAKVYGRIIEANPRIAEAHYQIGRILTEEYRVDAALRHLKEAVRLRPGETAVWLAWADAVALGGVKEDEQEFLRILAQAPVKPDLRIRLQDRFGAHRAGTRPVTGGLRPDEIGPLLALLERQPAAAEARAQALLKRHPGSALALNILGTAQAKQGRHAQAVASLKKALDIDPGYAEGHNNLARILIDMGDEDAAARHFRRAIMLAPDLTAALVNLATHLNNSKRATVAIRLLERAIETGADILPLYLALGNAQTRLKNYARAEAAFEQALKVQGRDARKDRRRNEALALLAQAQARSGKDQAALENFRKALELDPNSAVATSGLAALLQTLGQFDEAQAMFQRALAIDPLNGENYRLSVASYKVKPDDPILKAMLEAYDNPALTVQSRQSLGFAISKALEDTKDYDRVFRYLDEANALSRQENPYDIESRYHEIAVCMRAALDYDWAAPQIEGTSGFAPIFVTGMPRSGTTLVEQIISSHSTVTGAGELGDGPRSASRLLAAKEYGGLMAAIPPTVIAELGKGYEAAVRARFPGVDRITDKSIQTYMYIGLMKRALPNARFIVVRRDPRDNLLSIYKNKFPDDTHLYAYNQRDLAHYYKTFVDMIEFWRERVPGWLYEVDYDALVSDPEPETRKLIAACGLGWEDACLRPQDNDRKVETLSVFQARQPITRASVKGWKRYENDIAPMLDELRKLGLVSD